MLTAGQLNDVSKDESGRCRMLSTPVLWLSLTTLVRTASFGGFDIDSPNMRRGMLGEICAAQSARTTSCALSYAGMIFFGTRPRTSNS